MLPVLVTDLPIMVFQNGVTYVGCYFTNDGLSK